MFYDNIKHKNKLNKIDKSTILYMEFWYNINIKK